MSTTQSRIQELERMLAEREAQIAALTRTKTNIQVSDAGYVEIFGLPGKGRFSISLTPEGWTTLFAMKAQIEEFTAKNADLIKARLANYRAKVNTKAVG